MAVLFYVVGVTLLALIGYLYHSFNTKNQKFWPKHGVPLLKSESIAKRLWKGTPFVKIDESLYKQMGNLPYAGFMEANYPTVLLKDMELIRNVFVKDFEHFVNRRKFDSSNINFKNMLLNKEDQEWKDLRSTMSPTFSSGKIRRMYPILNESSKKLVACIKEEIGKDKSGEGVVNMDDVLGYYALDVISSAAFGIESGIFKDPDVLISRMAKKISVKPTFWLMLKFFAALCFPFLSKIIGFSFIDQEADNYFTTVLKESIKHRERTGEKRNDFLQLMIETKNGQLQEDSKESEQMDTYEKDAQLTNKRSKLQITDHTIIANCILFIFGGFDTVSSALMFSAYALALNPDIQEKLRSELEEAAENHGGELTYDDINKLEYLDKVISESLRMYPPGARAERRCTKDYSLGDGKGVIPKDSLVAIPVYAIHHDETHFQNPEVFDPERFSPEIKATRSPYAFMPFGHGPRSCIANRFAITETKSAIANLVMNFDIEPCAKSPIPLKFRNASALKPEGTMWLKIKSRQ